MKKLYKSTDDKIIFGILGGVSEYLERDSVAIRLLFLFLIFITGLVPGVIFYLIAALVVPEKNGHHGHRKNVENEAN